MRTLNSVDNTIPRASTSPSLTWLSTLSLLPIIWSSAHCNLGPGSDSSVTGVLLHSPERSTSAIPLPFQLKPARLTRITATQRLLREVIPSMRVGSKRQIRILETGRFTLTCVHRHFPEIFVRDLGLGLGRQGLATWRLVLRIALPVHHVIFTMKERRRARYGEKSSSPI